MLPFDAAPWFDDALRYFRAFGFFASHTGSDAELAAAIRAFWRGDWLEFLAGVSSAPAADQLLLVADTQRVWWRDLEGVYPGANYYAEVLGEWAQISRGQLAPAQIQELWHSQHGPVEVVFDFRGARYSFVHPGGDFASREILQLINQALARTPFAYEIAADFGDSNWVVVLTGDEKARLRRERGWRFLW